MERYSVFRDHNKSILCTVSNDVKSSEVPELECNV